MCYPKLQSLVKLIPKIVDITTLRDRNIKGERNECSICYEEWKDGDAITLSNCGHFAHKHCLNDHEKELKENNQELTCFVQKELAENIII